MSKQEVGKHLVSRRPARAWNAAGKLSLGTSPRAPHAQGRRAFHRGMKPQKNAQRSRQRRTLPEDFDLYRCRLGDCVLLARHSDARELSRLASSAIWEEHRFVAVILMALPEMRIGCTTNFANYIKRFTNFPQAKSAPNCSRTSDTRSANPADDAVNKKGR